MGKAEAGTPKYLANKMKAKGLQKLRWYCQMCQKQCRDDNGFKCHIQSEAHQRQLLLFAECPGKFLHNFSGEFTEGFMDIVRRRHSSKRVKANKVYQEYIADKNHIHMNSTRWVSLSVYVKWLGKTGQCVVDETDEGWYITYIDRSPEARERQERKDRKEKADKDDQERMMEFIEKQVERAKSNQSEENDADKFTELKRDNEEEPLKLDLKIQTKTKPEPIASSQNLLKRPVKESDEHIFKKPRPSTSKGSSKSALDEIREQEEAKKEKANRKDYWLTENIVVKFVGKSLGDKYYKQKAVVREVIDRYQAKIKFIESGEKVKVDQSHLETVIPALDRPVRVVNGAYRGSEAVLKSLNERKFCVTIEISKGPLTGRVVENVEYEDICKIWDE